MQIFIRIIVILFVIPFCALMAGMFTLSFMLQDTGGAGKQTALPLIVILVGTVGAIWLYVRSWKKADLKTAITLPPGSATSLRSGFVWALALVVGIPFGYVMFQSSLKDAERKRQPGHAEFQAANSLLIGSSNGIAHGNTADAQKLANEFSLRLKEARKLGIENRKSSSIVSLTRGEFLTYCLLTDDSCVFMVHVPDLRNFSPDAKDFIADAAWVTALAIVEPLRPGLRDVTVGLRGALLYDRVISGRLNTTENAASVRPGRIHGDTECQTFLQSHFAPRSPALNTSLPATPAQADPK